MLPPPNHHQRNNSVQFTFISLPTLQPDGLNMETRIKRNVSDKHIEQTKQKQNTEIINYTL